MINHPSPKNKRNPTSNPNSRHFNIRKNNLPRDKGIRARAMTNAEMKARNESKSKGKSHLKKKECEKPPLRVIKST